MTEKVPVEVVRVSDNEIYFILYTVHLDMVRALGVEFVISNYVNSIAFNVDESKFNQISSLFQRNSINGFVTFTDFHFNAFRS